ncbi:MAG: helix-turn-helix domain-containing protein [Myxococcales bacterium]|nr:helix-turn-helix domain-containing protein [Myxococcales bacterium]MDD9966657.1 helix-turn-helix domain-containing protein [Myxococcales bacterium]
MPNREELLLLDEVARICRVSLNTVRFWVQQGRLPSIRPGRRRLVRRSALDAFLGESPRRTSSKRNEIGGEP